MTLSSYCCLALLLASASPGASLEPEAAEKPIGADAAQAGDAVTAEHGRPIAAPAGDETPAPMSPGQPTSSVPIAALPSESGPAATQAVPRWEWLGNPLAPKSRGAKTPKRRTPHRFLPLPSLRSQPAVGLMLGASLNYAYRVRDDEPNRVYLYLEARVSLRKVQQLIRESKVEKRYFALLKGSPARDRFEVDAALKKNQLRGGERMVEVDEDDGKPSLSRFKVIQRFADCTLAEVQIITGRTHQIRVHALHAGHPLAGDPKYGDEAFNAVMKARGLKRLFLHAHSLRFPWGEHGAERHYTAPLAAELKAVLETLEKP